jgi:hypothetical protein
MYRECEFSDRDRGPVVTAEILALLMEAFFLGGRRVPIDHSVRGFPAGLGLARAQWPHHVGARHSRAGAMAGLRLWVIGLFVGIELIFYGGAWIALALDLRSVG